MHLWQDSFKITFDISLEKEKKLRKKKFSVRTDTAVIFRAMVTDASEECCHISFLLANMIIG